MRAKYEYKFVRLGEGWLGVKESALSQYQDVVHEHAKEGWRLVELFTPGAGVEGCAKYVEVILEREIES